MRELDLIRWIRDRCPPGAGVATGIGDDAAVLEWTAGREVVVSTDLLIEGIHFEPTAPPGLVGRKALAVSVSDLAAMGCRPRAALLAVALPGSRTGEYARALLEGARALAEEADTCLVGGDTTQSAGPVTLCSTVLGEPVAGRSAVRRSGARPGQQVLVTGRLGGSRAGRHLDFVPRHRKALALLADCAPGAMIDLSDGLSTDARHIAVESGVTVVLQASRIPLTDAALASPGDGAPLCHALNDGEDFELLFTLEPVDARRVEAAGLAGTMVTVIGEVRTGPGEVRIVTQNGKEEALAAGGFEHFR